MGPMGLMRPIGKTPSFPSFPSFPNNKKGRSEERPFLVMSYRKLDDEASSRLAQCLKPQQKRPFRRTTFYQHHRLRMMWRFLGLRRCGKRSILCVCEDFGRKRNAEIVRQATSLYYSARISSILIAAVAIFVPGPKMAAAPSR